MDREPEANPKEWRDAWPEHECRVIAVFAPSPCSECEALTQWFYYVECETGNNLSFTWYALCNKCQLGRVQIMRELYD